MSKKHHFRATLTKIHRIKVSYIWTRINCTVRQKVYTFKKSPQINISKYFQPFSYLWIAKGLFFYMRPKNWTIFHAWVSRGYFCERAPNPGILTGISQFTVTICACADKGHCRPACENAIDLKVESSFIKVCATCILECAGGFYS